MRQSVARFLCVCEHLASLAMPIIENCTRPSGRTSCRCQSRLVRRATAPRQCSPVGAHPTRWTPFGRHSITATPRSSSVTSVVTARFAAWLLARRAERFSHADDRSRESQRLHSSAHLERGLFTTRRKAAVPYETDARKAHGIPPETLWTWLKTRNPAREHFEKDCLQSPLTRASTARRSVKSRRCLPRSSPR